MPTVTFGRRIFRLESVPSTQDFLKEQLKLGAEEGTVAVASEQTAGRGRLERAWHSPVGKGLWVSVLIEPEGQQDNWTWVPLWAGIVVKQAVERIFDKMSEFNPGDLLLKWPNDVILDNRKLGGILAETVHDPKERRAVILGVGINLLQLDEDFPPQLRGKSISLMGAVGQTCSPDEMLELLLESFQDLYHLLKPVDIPSIRQLWLDAAWNINRPIQVLSGDKRYEGVFSGLGAYGEMCLQPEGLDPVYLSSADDIQQIEAL